MATRHITLISRPTHGTKKYTPWPTPQAKKPIIQVSVEDVRGNNGRLYCSPNCAEHDGAKVLGPVSHKEYQALRNTAKDPGPVCFCGDLFNGF